MDGYLSKPIRQQELDVVLDGSISSVSEPTVSRRPLDGPLETRLMKLSSSIESAAIWLSLRNGQRCLEAVTPKDSPTRVKHSRRRIQRK